MGEEKERERGREKEGDGGNHMLRITVKKLYEETVLSCVY